MAFPVIVNSSSGGTSTSDVTVHPVTLPSSIVVGNILLCVASFDGAPFVSVDKAASGNKWKEFRAGSTNSGAVTAYMCWKFAEGGDTLTLNSSVGEQSTYICYQISGGGWVHGPNRAAFDSSTNTNPPGLATPDGSQDYLQIATRHGDGTTQASAAPSGMSNLLTETASGANGASTATADQSATGTGVDPGGFTSASAASMSLNIGITPVDYKNYIYPFVEDVAQGATSTSDTLSHVITLPSGIVAGEQLAVFFSSDENTADAADITISIDTGASGSGWTIQDQVANGNFNVKGALVTKIAEGNGLDALTLLTDTAQQSSHISYRISNGRFHSVTSATSTGGTNTNPPANNPPSTGPYLGIASRHGDNTVVPTIFPQLHYNQLNQAASGSLGASTSTAERAFVAGSYDPGTFTVATEQWVSYTALFAPTSLNPILGAEGSQSRIFGGGIIR